MSLGIDVGPSDGFSDGAPEGSVVGKSLGMLEGTSLGRTDGCRESVGKYDGTALVDGTLVSPGDDGASEGCVDGTSVRKSLGTAECRRISTRS